MPVKMPVYAVTALSGRCEMKCRGDQSLNGRCTRQGALREQETTLGKARSMICDHHVMLLENNKVKVRTVRSDELL